MTKCVKCGGDIMDGAKFCSYCGAPVESGNTHDEIKEKTQVFVGTIRKCPNCGEQIGTNTTKCPACGFVIEKRNVSASLDAFVKKLASFDHYIKKREYIENYPVPNNKEDIRDLLTYAASQRDKDYDDNVAKAYWVDAWNNKCRQIVNQAFDTFGMDEDFSVWLKNYKAGVEKSSAENEKLKKKLRSIEKGKKRAAGGYSNTNDLCYICLKQEKSQLERGKLACVLTFTNHPKNLEEAQHSEKYLIRLVLISAGTMQLRLKNL